jgi:kynureninase
MSFYRPEGKRTKILIEAGAFPSDQYAVESQALLHGLNPDETIIELKPGKGEHTLHTEDIIAKINELGDELALIMLGGVNYYTGQLFAIQAITKAGKAVGAVVGYDLAHAIGNVPLQLHDWNVDFACWCTYKYLNSSPGGVGGIFVHQNHLDNPTPRLTGWWGYEEKTRFQMKKGFVPERSADAWQMSNVPILLLATHRASLELFREAGGMKPLREKSLQLTGFLEFVIQDISRALNFKIDIITPQNPAERGCQLSLIVAENGKTLHEKLTEAGIIADWREPSVIRVAPVPLYNSFEDAYNFGQILKESIMRLKMVSHWL